MKNIFLSIFIFLFFSCKLKQEAVENHQAMVVSAREEASQIGIDIIKKGGNAFDAMVATELALAVAYPYAGNIGGGGFMVYRKNNGEIGSLDYREKAPLKAHKDMFLDDKGEVITMLSRQSALAVGVPGTIAGVFAVHEKFGTLPIEELLKPVIALAEKGVVVTEKQEARLKLYKDVLIEVNGSQTLLAQNYKKGDFIQYAALAKTLKRIMKNGKDEFYKGETAQNLVNYLQAKGGIISLEDLSNYQAIWREPIAFNYKDLRIISMAPPSSGGITLGQIMKMIEPYDLKTFGHNQTKYIQTLVEAERRAYADRNHYLGDPDFVNIPIDDLLNPTYLTLRMSDFRMDKATKSSAIKRGEVLFNESTETTHYSIVDFEGNAVSATTTINDAYGSKLYCEALGFFLNNEMDDFSAKPGVPNMFGLIGNEANSIAPGKRMLSSMTPTIVEKDNQLYMVVGTPGGSTIITSVLQTILNVYEFDMTMQEAVAAPRFHHQWLPDVVTMEPRGFSVKLIQQLEDLGYIINKNDTPVIGKVDAIKVLEDGSLDGGADPRGDDAAVSAKSSSSSKNVLNKN